MYFPTEIYANPLTVIFGWKWNDFTRNVIETNEMMGRRITWKKKHPFSCAVLTFFDEFYSIKHEQHKIFFIFFLCHEIATQVFRTKREIYRWKMIYVCCVIKAPQLCHMFQVCIQGIYRERALWAFQKLVLLILTKVIMVVTARFHIS